MLERLSSKRCAEAWKVVKEAFGEDTEEEKAYWAYAVGLRDSWAAQSRAPMSAIHDTVNEITDLADALANKIAAHGPELKTIKGYLDVDQHTFMEADLRIFSTELKAPSQPTEAVLTRPRSMANLSAERTYLARALTFFLLAGGHKPMARVVAVTVHALLDLPASDGFDAKQVRDLTEDICRRFKLPRSERLRSRILDL